MFSSSDDYEVDEDGNIYRKKDGKLMKQYVQKKRLFRSIS